MYFARAFLERRTHGDDAAQSRQIGRGALLRAREHRNNGRHTDQERNRVFFCIFQTGARRKITQDNDLAAGVQRGAGPPE